MGLACISHRPPTAAAQWHALAGVRSVGMLDVVSTTPRQPLPALPYFVHPWTRARPSVANASHAAPLNRLATEAGEKRRPTVAELGAPFRNCLEAAARRW